MLERQSAYEFLNWGISDHSERTFFTGVFRFPQGEVVRFGSDASSWKDRQRRRWFDPALGGFTGDFAEAAEEFGALFKRSVARRMKGERPGFAISGGLDSSSVACTAARLERRTQIEGFFIRTPFPGHDETAHAQAAADTAGCPLVTGRVTFDGLLEGLDDMLRTSDEPFKNGRFYIHYLLCRLMAEHGVTLSLEGHGSDELLGGYDSFFLALFMEQRHKIGNARAFRQALRSLSLRGVSPGAAGLFLADGLLPSRTRSLLRKLAGRQTAKTRWFRFGPGDMPHVKKTFDYYNGCRRSVGRFSLDLLTRVNVPAMMRVVDRHTARFGIESRLPFLDEDLAGFCLSLPPEYLLEGGLTKRVLREAMKGVLPESVRMRKDKMGMELPEEVWIHGSGRRRFEELFRDSVRSARGLVSEAALGIPGNTRPGSTLPWRILIFGRWMDLFSVDPCQG
jgi:asparagine synthase (glutamine-hydrolysing)